MQLEIRRSVEKIGRRAYRKAAACIQSAQHRTACGSKESDPPFPFPPRGKPGRGKFPPRRSTCRASQNRWHGPCWGSPRKRGFAPPCAIPRLVSAHVLPPAARFRARKRINNGRHVGLDFYDLLLIEAFNQPHLQCGRKRDRTEAGRPPVSLR